MKTATKLEPGTYRLKVDVTNPRPDKRTRHSWRLQQTWKSGMIFKVNDLPAIYKSPGARRLWNGAFETDCFTSNDSEWELIAPNLERVEETPSDWIKRIHSGLSGGALGALDLLVLEGALTMEQVQSAVNRYYENIDNALAD